MIRVASYSLNLIELQFQTKCYNLYSPPDCAQVIRLVFFFCSEFDESTSFSSLYNNSNFEAMLMRVSEFVCSQHRL